MKKFLLTICILFLLQGCARGATYYVATDGSGDYTTIAQVNAASFSPGDSILFRRGDTWRGQLIPQSGSGDSSENILVADTSGYITYGAYGTGDKPKILGSYQKNDASDWTDEGGNIWSTAPDAGGLGAELLTNPSFDVDTTGWSLYFNAGDGAAGSGARTTVAGEFDSAPAGYKISCTTNGDSSGDIQFYTTSLSITSGKIYKLTFVAKASSNFTIDHISLHKQTSPYTDYTSVHSKDDHDITNVFTTFTTYFKADITATDSRITWYLGDAIPDGETLYIDTISIKECSDDEALYIDVGNIILNDEESCGVKEQAEVDLDTQGDFWFDFDGWILKLYSTANPATYYSNIECALKQFIINGTKHYVIFDNLDLRYGGRGMTNQSGHHQVYRSCYVSYIGGADQNEDYTIRYGNAFGFWVNNADVHNHLVEKCFIDNIYDAGISPQGGTGTYQVYDIYYFNNIISNCEYSYEQFYGVGVTVDGIYFENNTCTNAGGGWSHNQRWDGPMAKHIRWGDHTNVTVSDVYIRNNIFDESTENIIGISTLADVNKMNLDYNCYYTTAGNLVNISIPGPDITYTLAQFSNWQTDYSQDTHSIASDPLLDSDYRLLAGSPCIDAGADLTDVRDDYEGNPRPIGSGWDIGAYEWFSSRVREATVKEATIK